MNRQHLVETALGQAPADLLLKGARVVDVYTGQIYRANAAIRDGFIADVGGRPHEARAVLDLDGAYLCPGLIEPHSHANILYNPWSLAEGTLPLGTTTTVADTQPFFSVLGPEGFRHLVQDAARLPMRYFWLARLGSATPLDADQAAQALEDPWVLGTGEFPDWTALLAGEHEIARLVEKAHQVRKRVDGHAAGATPRRLAGLAALGLSACHEAVNPDEVLERLRLGYWTVLRHSSLRPDLPRLAEAMAVLTAASHRLMLTTDGSTPAFIEDEGHLAGMLRRLVHSGMPAPMAIRIATLNPAVYYGLDDRLGGIAPGRLADLVAFADLDNFEPAVVFHAGRVVAEGGRLVEPLPPVTWIEHFQPSKFPGADVWRRTEVYAPAADAPVLRLESAAIVRPAAAGESQAFLLDRGGRWRVSATLSGFGERVAGLATTFTVADELLVLGNNPADMALAAERVAELGGAIVLAEGGKVIWEIPLPLAGVMSAEPFAWLTARNRELISLLRERGYSHNDPLYSLYFLTCDFLPDIRLTSRGVLAVKEGRVIREPERLSGPQ